MFRVLINQSVSLLKNMMKDEDLLNMMVEKLKESQKDLDEILKELEEDKNKEEEKLNKNSGNVKELHNNKSNDFVIIDDDLD